MSGDLPEFKAQPINKVRGYIANVLTNPIVDGSHLIDVVTYDDGHYRVIFDPDYFVLAEDQTEPSKSQWNGLKKKLKRYDNQVFVFKEYGEIDWEGQSCCYLDFGYFAH